VGVLPQHESGVLRVVRNSPGATQASVQRPLPAPAARLLLLLHVGAVLATTAAVSPVVARSHQEGSSLAQLLLRAWQR
jgi:hypothetical protein